jgi:Protein NO VEIN, C-terminal
VGVEGTWLAEVKGLSGPRLLCGVTPNEFTAMNNAIHRQRYVLYVVCNAVDAPIASIFRWRAGAWRTEDGRALQVAPKTGAVLTCD